MKTLLETERLLLREITLDDKEDMLKLYANPEVQKYTGEPIVESLEEMEAAIQQRIKDYKKYGYGRWATILKHDMQFVGWAGLAYLWEFDEIDLGYRFLPEYWGKGYATEASHAILEYGLDQLDIKSIVAIAMEENKASIRVMEKVGMEFEKMAPYEIGSEDAIWYRCDKSLFTNQKKNYSSSMKIYELSERPDKIQDAIHYFWKCWGNDSNLNFYEDCISNSLNNKISIPKFYIGIESNEIIGSYALITNDLISRQDLMPWFACLFVNEKHRKKGYAEMFLNHGLQQSKLKGFDSLYLSTDLVNFYERKGWSELGKGFNFSGEEIKIYEKSTG